MRKFEENQDGEMFEIKVCLVEVLCIVYLVVVFSFFLWSRKKDGLQTVTFHHLFKISNSLLVGFRSSAFCVP